MVKQVTPAAAIDRLTKDYRRHAGRWAFESISQQLRSASVVSFPLHPPTQQQAMKDQQAAISWVESWRGHDGLAPHVVWEPRQWSLLGKQLLPLRVEISAPQQLASVIGKSKHWNLLVQRFRHLLEAFSDSPSTIGDVLVRHDDRLVALSDIDFQRLVDVVTWLAQHPASNLYSRQVPVRGVDTKWLEAHRLLVTALHTANTGRERLGLATKPSLWRIRFLDATMQLGPVSDLSAPLDQLAELKIVPSRVLVVENLVSLLTLPTMHDTVAIFGQGTAVSELTKLPWLHGPAVYYWGDLDTHGLRILHTLRSAGVQAISLMMDLPTLQAFQDLWSHEAKRFTGDLTMLTREETQAYEYLLAHPGTRLEQERIDWSHVLEVLRAQGLLSEALD